MSYYEDGYYSSDSDTDPLKELTLEDFMNNIETEQVLEDEFFEKFKKTMENIIEGFYCEEVDYVTENYMDVFDKDYNKKKAYDFLLTIYPFITKNYDITIFEKFPCLANPILKKKEEKEEIKQSAPAVFESKTYDWSAKKI
tara:strand:+ start:479 stop:901 length:423 start_codon:yes stop_codon:yes gene_type:complete